MRTIFDQSYNSQEEIIPDLLVCYAIEYKIQLVFTDCNVNYVESGNESSDMIFQRLLGVTNQLFGSHYDFRRLEKYYNKLSEISVIQLNLYMLLHLEEIMEIILPNIARFDYIEPHSSISDYINFICSQYGCLTVLNPLAGSGTIAYRSSRFNLYYTLYERSAIVSCILTAIFKLRKIGARVLYRKDQLYVQDYDALVCVLPQDYVPEKSGDEACIREVRKAREARSIHETLFNEILSGNTPERCAIIVVNREFCYSDRFYEIRKQLVTRNLIHDVTSIPDYLKEKGQETGVIIILDFKRVDESDNISFVPTSMLRELIRKYEDPHGSADYEGFERAFPVLSQIPGWEEEKYDSESSVENVCFSHNDYVVSSEKVAGNAYMLIPELYPNHEAYQDEDDGENESHSAYLSDILKVHADDAGGFDTITIKKKAEQGSVVLDFIDNELIEFKYLLHEINGATFQNYLSLINQLPESEHISYESMILNYRINFPALECQHELIESWNDRQNSVIKPRKVYNVIVAGDVDIKGFSKWDINILAKVDRSENFNDVVNDSSISRLLDAVIINVNLDMSNGRYKGLRRILKDKKHLIFVIGDTDMKDLEADLDPEDLTYCKDGKLFSNQELDDLIRALRKELDYQDSPESKIKEYYQDVFEASGRIDAYFKTEKPVSDFLIQMILDNYRKNASFKDVYDTIRAICERLVKELQNVNVLPPYKSLGAVTKFLIDNCYSDKQMGICYLRKKILPVSLSESLNYLTKICNKAIHTQENLPQLGSAVVNILMSLVLWFDEQITRGVFDEAHDPDEYWMTQVDIDSSYLHSNIDCIKEVDCLEKEDGSFYYFCGQTHLEVSPNSPLKKGMNVRVKKVTTEQQPYVDDDHFVVFYAKRGNYEIL